MPSFQIYNEQFRFDFLEIAEMQFPFREKHKICIEIKRNGRYWKRYRSHAVNVYFNKKKKISILNFSFYILITLNIYMH